MNAIQTTCPHILRYLAAAVIINRSRRSALKDLVKVIQQVSINIFCYIHHGAITLKGPW
jgi:hypothetical protein